MDWTTIITALLSLIGGGGLATFITWRASKKKSNAEADSAAFKALEQAHQLIAELEKEKADLNDQLADKRDECTTKGFYMCVHQGCVCRRPAIGRGKIYFSAHKHDECLDSDFTPIEDLVAQYKRKPTKEKDDNVESERL